MTELYFKKTLNRKSSVWLREKRILKKGIFSQQGRDSASLHLRLLPCVIAALLNNVENLHIVTNADLWHGNQKVKAHFLT